jgi:TolA-binding protein
MILKTSNKRPLLAIFAIALMASAAPVQAQKAATADATARINKIEAELKAVQRVVFPGGDGKYFPPEIEKGTVATTATGTPATTPVTDLLTRMESVEAQMSRLTAQGEENGNRIAQLEAKLAALTPPPVAVAPAALTDGTAPDLAKPVETAPAAKPAITTANLAPASAAQKPKPAIAPVAEKPASPSAKRVAAVKAIEKPATDDAGDDEYSYGFRLWEAKFFPEAEQQLQLYISKYPKHARISFGRNLLGRTLLDDGKPKEAAQWFLKNYQADAKGARAPDSLIYLAESMRQLKDVKRACIALGEFADGYRAESEGRLKTIYNEVKSGVKCN